MPGFVPGIHIFAIGTKDADGIATRACPSAQNCLPEVG